VQHTLLGGIAVTAALFPSSAYRFARWARVGVGRWVLAVVLLGSLSLVLWVPPPLPGWGVDGLVNQVLGVLGAPISWGAIAPGAVGGPALFLRWIFEYLLIGGFAALAVLAPDRVFPWLGGQGTTDREAVLPVPTRSLDPGLTVRDARVSTSAPTEGP
jgi:hypothetical protein